MADMKTEQRGIDPFSVTPSERLETANMAHTYRHHLQIVGATEDFPAAPDGVLSAASFGAVLKEPPVAALVTTQPDGSRTAKPLSGTTVTSIEDILTRSRTVQEGVGLVSRGEKISVVPVQPTDDGNFQLIKVRTFGDSLQETWKSLGSVVRGLMAGVVGNKASDDKSA